jgi:uncharacterized protein (DUF488 family)
MKRNSSVIKIYTIGHSTHPIEEFIGMLKAYDIHTLVDIRSIPASRRYPQFSQDSLMETLRKNHISYVHIKDLGGRRQPAKDSHNMGWRNKSFRGYADYMETARFEAALKKLIALAEKHTVSIMCAEAVPWRCHRSLVGDALAARQIEVVDIFSKDKSSPHRMTPFAHIKGNRVTYPQEQGTLL